MKPDYVTKEDLRREMQLLEDKLDTKLNTLKNELIEAGRYMQSELLRGMEVMVRGSEAKFARLTSITKSLVDSDTTMGERMTNLETRLHEIELRLLRPPGTS